MVQITIAYFFTCKKMVKKRDLLMLHEKSDCVDLRISRNDVIYVSLFNDIEFLSDFIHAILMSV